MEFQKLNYPPSQLSPINFTMVGPQLGVYSYSKDHEEVLDLSVRSPLTPQSLHETEISRLSPNYIKEEDKGNEDHKWIDLSSDSTSNQPDTTNSILQMIEPVHTTTKITRPFKAYPKDPLMISTIPLPLRDTILTRESLESYEQFRHKALSQVKSPPLNPRMQRSRSRQDSTEDKDDAYWERRRRNNAAAKRSRDARRAKEDELAIRAAFLEHENIRLKIECSSLRAETINLRNELASLRSRN